jgi:hypothetical protein
MGKKKGVNFWMPEEDKYMEENYRGYASIPFIAKNLGRTEKSVANRIAITISGGGGRRMEAEKQACILHSLDLLKSGGRFS